MNPPAQRCAFGRLAPVLWWALLVVALISAVVVTAGCSAREGAEGESSGGAQPLSGPRGAAPPARAPAPDFTLPLLDGSTEIKLSDLRGRTVVLNFWASWCAPCRAEASTLNAVARSYADKDVSFIGINIQDAPSDARRFVQQYGVGYPNVADVGGAAAFSYGVAGLPSTYFIDRDGRVGRRSVGPLSEKQLVAFVDELRS